MKNLIILLAVALSFTACQSEAEKKQKEAEEQAEQAQEGLQQGMKELENLAKNMQNGQGEVKQPVNFRELKALLPGKVAGMDQSDLEGQTSGTMGFTISQASADYRTDDKSIEISILDAGGMPAAVMGMAAWSMATIDKETSKGYEKTGTFDGYKSYEKFDNDGKNGQISLLVANRFIVNVEGDRVDMGDLKSAVKQIDLKKLSKLE